MKKVLVLVLTAALIFGTSPAVLAQRGSRDASSSETPTVTTEDSEPAEEEAQPPVFGTGFENLPESTGTEPEVVAIGVPDSLGYIPFVVRNGSPKTIESVQVVIEARDQDGQLVAVSDNAFSTLVVPVHLKAGMLGIGTASIDIPESVTNVEYTGKVVSYERGGFSSPLYFDNARLMEDRLIGEFRVKEGKNVDTVYLHAVCFNTNGQILEHGSNLLQYPMPTEEPIPFQIDFFFESEKDCETYIVAGWGT